MRLVLVIGILFGFCCALSAQEDRHEAEYYVEAYALHYGLPLDFARAIVDEESGWQRCVESSKRAVGLMQLMPDTARRLGVQDRCSVQENVSGGIRYIAWLMQRFRGDLRLVAAAYYTGEHAIARRGLQYSNPDVVGYVSSIRERTDTKRFRSSAKQRASRRKQR